VSDENSDAKPAEPPPTGQPRGVPEKPVAERSMLDKPDDQRSIQDKSLNDKSVILSDDPGPLPPHQDLDVVDVRHGMFGGIGTGDTSGFGGLVRPVAIPGATQRPYGGWFDTAADRLEAALQANDLTDALDKAVVHRGEITFHIKRERLVDVMQQLRDDPALRFEFCC
jgi:hypothetical protein